MVINAMSEILKERRDQQGKQVPTEDSARLSNIENQLAKLTKAIMEAPQTYAQAIQKNGSYSSKIVGRSSSSVYSR